MDPQVIAALGNAALPLALGLGVTIYGFAGLPQKAANPAEPGSNPMKRGFTNSKRAKLAGPTLILVGVFLFLNDIGAF